LKDLAAHEEDTSFFAPEYAYILNNADVLMQEFKRQPAKLERIYGNLINNVLPNHI
jgi:Bardet-Biedl syndrome 7 protein